MYSVHDDEVVSIKEEIEARFAAEFEAHFKKFMDKHFPGWEEALEACAVDQPLKVYIAQPMDGWLAEEINAVRKYAEIYIQEQQPSTEIEFLNRYHPEWDDIPRLKALGKSLEILSEADVAYFCPGWKNSLGCRIEQECCDMYGIPALIVE